MGLSRRIGEVLASEGDALLFRGRWYDWPALGRVARLASGALEAAGVASDAPVAIILRNRPSGVAAFLGIIATGRCAVQISPIQPPASLAAAIERIRPAAIIADREDWSDGVESAAAAVGAAGIELWETDEALQAAPRAMLERVGPGDHYREPDDAGIVVPTSGTTGPPKLVPLARGNLARYVPKNPAVLGQTPRVLIIAAPLTTVTGLNPFLTWAARPMRLALIERLNVVEWAALVREYQPREGGLPPAALRMLLDSDVPRDSLKSLSGWYTGAAPVDPAAAAEFEEQFGVPVLIAYGATEFGGGPVARMTPEDRTAFGDAKRGSAGRPLPDVRLRIVDPDSGAELGANERGLLHVHCPRAVVRDAEGWTATNDLAHIDEDGFLYIDGRADDVIIRGGFKVPLFEVESAMSQHPILEEVAAVGAPDERLGQVPVLLYVAGRTVDPGELREWARERLAPYKVPVRFERVESLPKTATMKLSRPGLREMVAQLMAGNAAT